MKQLGAHIEAFLAKVEMTDGNELSSTCGQRITWSFINLYHINGMFVMPWTKERKTADLLNLWPRWSNHPTGTWFASHEWLTPFKDTLAMLGSHATCHELPESDTYWVCTFANRQHSLEELGGNVLETPFVRAMKTAGCVGTLVLCDASATHANESRMVHS